MVFSLFHSMVFGEWFSRFVIFGGAISSSRYALFTEKAHRIVGTARQRGQCTMQRSIISIAIRIDDIVDCWKCTRNDCVLFVCFVWAGGNGVVEIQEGFGMKKRDRVFCLFACLADVFMTF